MWFHNKISGLLLLLYRQCGHDQELDQSKVTLVKVNGHMGQVQGLQVKNMGQYVIYCDVPGSPCLSKKKANQMCGSFLLNNFL